MLDDNRYTYINNDFFFFVIGENNYNWVFWLPYLIFDSSWLLSIFPSKWTLNCYLKYVKVPINYWLVHHFQLFVY